MLFFNSFLIHSKVSYVLYVELQWIEVKLKFIDLNFIFQFIENYFF